jgi:hypothetical protein
MPTPDVEFQFAEFAISTPETRALLNEREAGIRADVKPENIIELMLTSELIHAGWELERVRQLAHNRDAEPRLATANARASRNWHRARKFLKKLQRAQASQFCTQLSQEARSRLAACPLADLTRLPKPIDLDIEPEQETN